MDIQEILLGKEKLIKYLKENGFTEERDYSDEEYNNGSYFKIDNRKLLVIYEVSDDDKIKEIKNHFLIDRSLNYCVIVLPAKLVFFNNVGETKHFIYSERTKDDISKIDKLKNIRNNFDSLFYLSDISAPFYEAFKNKRNLIAQNIKNNVEPVKKYLIAQKIFDRFFFIYFLCHKEIIKFEDGSKISGKNLFKILLENGDFLNNLKDLFRLFNSQEKNILKIGDYRIFVHYLNGGLFRPDVLEQQLEIRLKKEQWKDIFDFLNSYHWIIEDIKGTEENEEKILTPEILGHVYERSVVEWESEGFEREAENAIKNVSERKNKGVYYTPEYVTENICNKTISAYLCDKLENKYFSFEELIKSKNKRDMGKALEILKEIKVLDPACGSGAFLIKAASVIFKFKRRLLKETTNKNENFYDLKLETITDNIYGVDILAGAIEISKLRLWLWLISDFEESKNEIKALPNIEYNLKVGNSLIGWLDEKFELTTIIPPLTEGLDNLFTGMIAFSEDSKEIDELKHARDLLKNYKLEGYIEAYYVLYKIYRRAHGLKAENLRGIIETIRKSIYATINPAFLRYINYKIAGIDLNKPHKEQSTKYKSIDKNPPILEKEFSELQVFHWRIDFGHIILNGGFDVVIGNPPYGNILKKEEIKIIQNIYEKSAATCDIENKGTTNTIAIFIERAYSLMKTKSLLGFIVANTILRIKQYQKVRKFILNYYKIVLIVDESNPFEVGMEMVTLILKKEVAINYSTTIYSKRLREITEINGLPEIFKRLDKFMIYYDKMYDQILNINPQTNICVKRPTLRKAHYSERGIPIIASGNVEKYKIKYDKIKGYVTTGDVSREVVTSFSKSLSKNRIIIFLSCFNCAIKEEGFVSDGTLLTIKNSQLNNESLVVLLNNKVISYLFSKYCNEFSYREECDYIYRYVPLICHDFSEWYYILESGYSDYEVLFDMVIYDIYFQLGFNLIKLKINSFKNEKNRDALLKKQLGDLLKNEKIKEWIKLFKQSLKQDKDDNWQFVKEIELNIHRFAGESRGIDIKNLIFSKILNKEL